MKFIQNVQAYLDQNYSDELSMPQFDTYTLALKKGVNYLTSLIIGLNLLLVPTFAYYLSDPRIILGGSIEIAMLIGVIAFNLIGRHKCANALFVITLNLATLYFGVILGPTLAIVLMLIFLAGVAMFVFESKVEIAASIAFSLFILGVLVFVYDYRIDVALKRTSQQDKYLEWAGLLTVFSLVVIVFGLFARIKNGIIKAKDKVIQGQDELIIQERGLNETRDHHLRAVAHEMNSTLNMANPMAELVLQKVQGQTDVEQLVKYFFVANSNLQRLGSNLLHVDRFQRGHIEPNYELCYIEDVVREMIHLNIEYAALSNSNIRLAIPNVSPRLNGIGVDIPMLKMIINNLIQNAIKNCVKGTEIIVSLLANEDNALISVRNNISRKLSTQELEEIFEPSHKRIEKADSKRVGIGLSITRQAVNSMNGGITVTCDDNYINFFVRLPKSNIFKVKGASCKAAQHKI